jgi:Histone chaperone domain CHZ
MVELFVEDRLMIVDMAEIDPTNIVSRRTRGKKIDFAKEAQAAGNDLEDDDEEDEEYV